MPHRPPWDDSISDTSLLNAARPAACRTYFSKPPQVGRQPRTQNRIGGSSSFAYGRHPGHGGLCERCGAKLAAPDLERFEVHLPDNDVGFQGPLPAGPAPVADSGCSPGGGVSGSASAAQLPYLALSPTELAADFRRRRVEITAALARGWAAPSTVRRLKRELQELNSSVQRLTGTLLDGGSCSSRGAGEKPPRGRSPSQAGRPTEELDPQTPPRQTEAAATEPAATPPGKAPPPAQGSKGKGAGKGKAPPPPSLKGPPASAGQAPGKGGGGKGPAAAAALAKGASPFGRTLHWRPVPAEKLAGTVWADLATEADVRSDTAVLQHLFGRVPEARTQAVVRRQEVELFSHRRAQNILIALRRQPLTAEAIRALAELDFETDALSTDAWEVLSVAMPTPEEAKLLLSFRGHHALLRAAEREVLPLASLRMPPALQRLEALPATSVVASQSVLPALAARASLELSRLDSALARTRAEAASTLAYFAEPAGGDDEVDRRSAELLCTLRDFAQDLGRCIGDLDKRPDLAAMCEAQPPVAELVESEAEVYPDLHNSVAEGVLQASPVPGADSFAQTGCASGPSSTASLDADGESQALTSAASEASIVPSSGVESDLGGVVDEPML